MQKYDSSGKSHEFAGESPEQPKQLINHKNQLPDSFRMPDLTVQEAIQQS